MVHNNAIFRGRGMQPTTESATHEKERTEGKEKKTEHEKQKSSSKHINLNMCMRKKMKRKDHLEDLNLRKMKTRKFGR